MSKQKSVAAETAVVESNPGAGLPVGFGAWADTIAVGDPLFTQTAYVSFVSPKGQAWAELARKLPGLQDGDPVLVRAAPVKLNPFRFYLIAAHQHYSVVDSLGAIVRSTRDARRAKAPGPDKWVEHVEAVLIVCLEGGGLAPARCTFKSTKTNCVHKAIEARRLAEDRAAWSREGPEHKVSASVEQPWARYTTTATFRRGVSRSSGYAYVAANGFVVPTSLADWQALGKAFKDEDFTADCQAVMLKHTERVASVTAKEV